MFAQLEKARLVGKLKAARDRKRAAGVKVEGRKSYREANPEMVAMAKRLRRKAPKGGRRSLRVIAGELAKAGFLTPTGKPYAPAAVARMIAASAS